MTALMFAAQSGKLMLILRAFVLTSLACVHGICPVRPWLGLQVMA